MGRVLRKPTFCIICENKGADQLHNNHAADTLRRNVGQFGPWTIRTLVNSDLLTGQFGPRTVRTLVNSDLLTLVNSDHSLWSIRTSYCGQFGPRPLVNSDPDNLSVRTLTFCCVKSISIFVLMIMRTWSYVGD